MKKIYLMLSMACASLLSTAQIYEDNFDEIISDVNLDKSVFALAATGSNLVISSQGHDEWDAPKYYFHDELGRTSIKMSGMDTIYVRARATFGDISSPLVRFTVFDDSGVQPGNNELRDVNSLTLTNEWQVLKYVVPNWFDQDVSNSTPDTNNLTGMVISINGGFGSFPGKNALDEDIDAPFVGAIYVDYISIGSMPESGTELTTTSAFTEDFSTDVSKSIWSSGSFSTSISGGQLSISTAGHEEFDFVRYALPELVDLTSNAALEFEAIAIAASGYTGNLGIKLIPVDHAGNRLEYTGDVSYQSLSSTSKKVQVVYNNFTNFAGKEINKTKIAFVDVLINGGFATQTTTNELGQSLSTAFEGEIIIDQIRLGEGISVNGISEENEVLTSFYPNPTTNVLNFRNDAQGGEYKVYNSAGLEVVKGIVNSSVDVSYLETGLYFIEVIKNGKVSTKSFIKQ